MLITAAVTVTKFNTARAVVHPLIRRHMTRAGTHLLPMTAFLAFALGMVVIGQTTLIMNRYGAQAYVGTVMVTVVVRELGPLFAALLVLARVGTANVVELGTSRALGEVEALEALGIDPIHYLVVPRVIGVALSIFSLTIYFILFALLSGYLFAFLEGMPILPGEYFGQLAEALLWQDFILLALKTMFFWNSHFHGDLFRRTGPAIAPGRGQPRHDECGGQLCRRRCLARRHFYHRLSASLIMEETAANETVLEAIAVDVVSGWNQHIAN